VWLRTIWFTSFSSFYVSLIVFPQQSQDQDLGLFSVCGFSLVPSFYLLFTSFRAKLHAHALQIWTQEGRLRISVCVCVCECVCVCKEINFVQEWYKYPTRTIHIPYTDVFLKTFPYHVHATVFSSGGVAVWLQSQCPHGINSAVCSYRLNMLYCFNIITYFCIEEFFIKY
jgi:hypothetical protein